MKEWRINNPEVNRNNAKLGHKSCPRISKPEIKLQLLLKHNKIEFIPQKEYALGFADIFIEPNIMIFVDGKYWHNYPSGLSKDVIQTKWLQNHGFRVIRIWEDEIDSKIDTILSLIKTPNTSYITSS